MPQDVSIMKYRYVGYATPPLPDARPGCQALYNSARALVVGKRAHGAEQNANEMFSSKADLGEDHQKL